uniref:C-C chemokine receptor type 7-like n=1 Tax=Centroberyx gerrardi TaxID=166262 RepID=UPI003AAA88C9
MNINDTSDLFINSSITDGDLDTFPVSHPSDWPPWLIFACLVVGACCLLGIPANIVVIARLSCRLRHSTMTEHLFFNLAVSDLLFLLCIPAVAILIIAPYQFYFFFLFFCFSSGFFIVVLISVQRYYQVLHPQKWARLGQRGQWVLLLGMWVLAALLSLPALFLPEESDVGISPRGLHILLVLGVVYISLPVFSYLVMITFYIRLVRGVNRRKFFNDSHSRMTKLIIRIIASSLAFSIPPLAYRMLQLAAILTHSDTLLELSDKLSFVSSFYFFKSCLNPFLYFFASRDRSGCDTERPMEESPHDEDTV